MLSIVLHSSLAFAPPQSLLAPTARRELLGRALGGALAAGATIAPAWAVAPPSPQQMLKSRAVYGSRVFRLQDASPATIMEEKNVFTLFTTGVYGATADKPTRVQLEKLEKENWTALAGHLSAVVELDAEMR